MARRNRLLTGGPFADALRAAVGVRGLGIERLCVRLADAGTPVSAATLSYWQSGRSRPERRSSMAALAALETILEVPAGSLSALLGPPRRRTSVLGSRPFGAFWPEPDRVSDLVGAVDVRWDDRLSRISQHDRVAVGAERGERSVRSRQVLRAEADGPDRWVAVVHIDDHSLPLPRIEPVRYCRLGRVVGRRAEGLIAAELLFERPLRRGETVIFEHEVVGAAPYPLATNYERKFRRPVREFTLEVCFDPATLPPRLWRFAQEADLPEQVEEVPMGSGGSAHAVTLNFGPGRYGFRWDWTV
ncbi:hypothetical protein [Phytomonospora endophytica]|uniref:Uncharacterized protein n=1 Tax=Phytomonospora endophytica TaxID=714109 RepID=A0A841FP80_9ACTN|nr:hypothetical protein [Phytomonospora endophytica]MBB6037906.1 hypothetical protein [Phytomonospora endophytica]GIG68806.1 hypothetical protein Pen01_51010 [Phytomonospora endophytica]